MAKETERHIGFSGTRKGMTEAQKTIVTRLFHECLPACLHHGVCIGADAEAHGIGQRLGMLLAGHPPKSKHYLATELTGFDFFYPEADYLSRNRNIVEATSRLIATPADAEERSPRSGTWATIRYAKLRHKLVTIVHADGRLEWRSP